MGLLRRSVSVRLEESTYLRLRRHCLRSGVPTSALVRALVRRWFDEQEGGEGEATTEPRAPGWDPEGNPERDRQPGLFGEGGAPS